MRASADGGVACSAFLVRNIKTLLRASIHKFFDAPPPGNLVAELWDARVRRGYPEEPSVKMDPTEENQLLEKLTAFRKPAIELNEGDVVEDEMVWITRSIRRKRGSWYQMPKD